MEKEFVHVDTFKELFPFAKALITTLSANAGIPPIMVKNVDIETFKTEYTAFLDTVRSKYPDAHILNLALETSRYLDTIKMFEYGFNNYTNDVLFDISSYKTCPHKYRNRNIE